MGAWHHQAFHGEDLDVVGSAPPAVIRGRLAGEARGCRSGPHNHPPVCTTSNRRYIVRTARPQPTFFAASRVSKLLHTSCSSKRARVVMSLAVTRAWRTACSGMPGSAYLCLGLLQLALIQNLEQGKPRSGLEEEQHHGGPKREGGAATEGWSGTRGTSTWSWRGKGDPTTCSGMIILHPVVILYATRAWEWEGGILGAPPAALSATVVAHGHFPRVGAWGSTQHDARVLRSPPAML